MNLPWYFFAGFVVSVTLFAGLVDGTTRIVSTAAYVFAGAAVGTWIWRNDR